jgi:Holliday junction resolvase RusA-like endonuclease
VKVDFKVSGEPQGKARPRFTSKGRPYTPQKTADYEERIGWAYRQAGGKLNLGEVTVSVWAYFGVPRSKSVKKQNELLDGNIAPLKKPDADNIAKAVLDALNGVAWGDDTQVGTLIVKKQWGLEPRIEVCVCAPKSKEE